MTRSSYETFARSVALFTSTFSMPFCFLRVRSMMLAHEAQCIPVTFSVAVFIYRHYRILFHVSPVSTLLYSEFFSVRPYTISGLLLSNAMCNIVSPLKVPFTFFHV